MISRGKFLANLARKLNKEPQPTSLLLIKKDNLDCNVKLSEENMSLSTSGGLLIEKSPNSKAIVSDSDSSDELEDFDPSEEEYVPSTSVSDSEESLVEPSPTFSPITPIQKRIRARKSKESEPNVVSKNDEDYFTPIELLTNPNIELYNLNVENQDLQVGKKRQRNSEKWKSNIKKKKYNNGEAYEISSGKVIPERRMALPCGKKCRLKCWEFFSVETRNLIFEKFWKLDCKTLKWNFILTYSETSNKKTAKLGNTRRNCTRMYFFPINQIKRRVCLTMFLNTLGINYQWVETAHEKLAQGNGVLSPDKRGKHARNINDVGEVTLSNARKHINSLDKLPSHYARKNSSRDYIDNINSISALHRLYREWCKEHNIEDVATERQYRDIFLGEFNISLHRPKKDQCNLCISKKLSFEGEVNERDTEFSEHIINKIKARNLKESDKQEAIDSSGKISCVCFDFQKILTCPRGQTNIFYYLRKLALYNFTVYSLENKVATCYVWDETMGKRGAVEVISCLSNYMISALEKGVKEFRFWSDNCPGQNKNQYIFSFYAWFTLRYNVTICHRFLEKGHTQNEADSVHSTIETACKNKTIYTPAQWFMLIRQAKIKGQPYNVIEMAHDEFFDYKKCVGLIQNKKDESKDKICWTKVREVRTNAENPYEIRYKYNFDDTFNICVIIPSKNLKKQEKFMNFTPTTAYSTTLPISQEKKSDLLTLCQGNFIPKVYQQFFYNLPTVECGDINIDEGEEGNSE